MKYTPAQCRAAFYHAAANIEARPELYRFMEARVGKGECSTCMWGHVGRVIECSENHCGVNDVPAMFGLEHDDLTVRFREFNAARGMAFSCAANSVARLRAFADHHWPVQHEPSGQSFPELMASLQDADASRVTS